MRPPKIIVRILGALELQPMTRIELERVLCLAPRGAEQPLQELARLGAIRSIGWTPGQAHAKMWRLAE